MAHKTHKIVWHFVRCNEFCGCNVTETEEYDSWEAANARIFELLSKFQTENDLATLTIKWYDGDDIAPLYRRFQLDAPDRG